ncbi:MAG: hypothetical protein AAF546_09680 [Verrucomicrobiota bacterium]
MRHLSYLLIVAFAFVTNRTRAEKIPDVFAGLWRLNEQETNSISKALAEKDGKEHIEIPMRGFLPTGRLSASGNYIFTYGPEEVMETYEFFGTEQECYIFRVNRPKQNISYLTLNWIEGKKWYSKPIDVTLPLSEPHLHDLLGTRIQVRNRIRNSNHAY